MSRHGCGFAESRLDKAQIVGDAMQQPGRHRDELGKAAIDKVARRALGGAGKGIPGEALAAAPTSVGVLLRHHTVTNNPTLHIAAHLGYLSGEFVADHDRRYVWMLIILDL